MSSPMPQYSTIFPWLGPLPGWVPETDKIRVAAYDRYEEIYWSSEEGFEELLRGDNENPVFMPTAMTVVNTVNRYTAPDFGWRVDELGSDLEQEGTAAGEATETGSTAVQVARLAFSNLFKRERFLSKFSSNKLKGMYRGDWLWHIVADDTKPLGRRIKIMPIHPAAYFPVYEDDIVDGGDPDKLMKVHLAEMFTVNSQDRVNRLTYERIFDADGEQTGIQVSQAVFEMEEWNKPDGKPESVIIPATLLPDTIPAIPVYHIPNGDSTERFGSSELRGLESVVLGINQTISDEDLTLAVEGLGIYITEGGPPVDSAGNAVEWVMGPGRVLSNAKGMQRLNGAGSMAPYQDHYKTLLDAVYSAKGIGDVARGRVGAAEMSGIALLLELGPILSYTADKDLTILDVHAQMFHDLCFWLTEYEELPLLVSGEGGELTPAVLVQPTIGQKIPVNQQSIIDNVISLRSTIPPVISMATAHALLKAAGVPIADNEADQITEETSAQAAADAAAVDSAIGGAGETLPIDEEFTDAELGL